MLQRRKQHQPLFHYISANLQSVGHCGESPLSLVIGASKGMKHSITSEMTSTGVLKLEGAGVSSGKRALVPCIVLAWCW